MNYCTITPDRGDRPELFKFCIHQLNRMNGGPPTNAYLMNDKPTSDAVDIVPRIRKGIELAQRDGFEWVFIVENDDYYPANYFDNFKLLNDYDFVGFSSTTYYNIKNRTFETLKHHGRSSLFCTGFKISALDNFQFAWLDDDTRFLDIRLWEYANRFDKKIHLIKDNPCLGIKHGIGKCGGKGHVMHLKNQDKNLYFLKTFVDAESFEFYSKLSDRL